MRKKPKPKTGHGGKRSGAGRKPLPESERAIQTTVWLRADEQAKLRQIAPDGTVSGGIRVLLSRLKT